MSMFKTIGMVTGGVILGVGATIFIKNKSDVVDIAEDIIKEKTEGILQSVGRKMSSDNDEGDVVHNEHNRNLSEDSRVLLRKTMQAEGIVAEMKEVISTDIETSKDTVLRKVGDIEHLMSEIKDIINPEEGDDKDKGEHDDKHHESLTSEEITEIIEDTIERENDRVESIVEDIVRNLSEDKDE